jgi:hypothetical protein
MKRKFRAASLCMIRTPTQLVLLAALGVHWLQVVMVTVKCWSPSQPAHLSS